MTVTSVEKDFEAATMTIVSEFDAGTDRVWRMWADPRLLEKWWGPPAYPATFVDHDLSSGGVMTYFMTGPEGDRHWGRWEVKLAEEPHLIEVKDSFAHEGGEANTEMPAGRMRIEIEQIEDSPGRTRMTIVNVSASPEQLKELIEMGQEEGMKQSLGQIDALL